MKAPFGAGCVLCAALTLAIAVGCASTPGPATTPTSDLGLTPAPPGEVAVEPAKIAEPDETAGPAAPVGSATNVPTSPPAAEATGPTVTIAGVTFLAELAATPERRAVGLSGHDSLAPQTGMLFTWETGVATVFWMRGMRFPLDFVWISKDCVVVDITSNVPAPLPETPSGELPSYRSAASAAYTFEINAGETQKHRIVVGAPVRFTGIPTSEARPCS